MKYTKARKSKFIASKNFIDEDTGEVIPFAITMMEDKDFDFHKVWLQNLITTMSGITNRKMELAFWIIAHLNKENQLIYNQKQMAELTGLSKDTVTKTISALIESNFLIKLRSGCYMVNPDVMYKGSHRSRMGIVFDYSSCVNNEKIDNEEIKDTEDDEYEDTADTEKTSS